MNEAKWYLRTQDETFGPETQARLIDWARVGRIQPGQEISDDNIIWQRVEDVPFLDMRFSIDIGDGNPRGPFHRAAAEALLASGRLPSIASIVEVRAPFEPVAAEPVPEPEAPPAPQVQVIEKIVEVEKIVEKEVPIEVEKIIEKRVEVPVEVEKIVEKIVEKVVVDETRVKELEELLEAERRHTAELQAQMDAVLKSSAEREAQAQEKVFTEVRDSSAREAKLREQVVALENEIRRLPQSASEIASIQAAIYAMMTCEAEELHKLYEEERKEADEFRRRHQERAEHLLERRRELLRRTGSNIEDMTRKALIERPEDPRTAQLRKELQTLQALSERKAYEAEHKIAELTEQLRLRKAEDARSAEGMKDITQLRAEVQSLNERLQAREKDLMAERQKNETLRQQQATSQQTLMARLAKLESPSIGSPAAMETNQSREARMVKLPGWMKIRR